MERYVYFRTTATLADDDDDESSCLFPLSSFISAYTAGATTIILRFKKMKVSKSDGSYDNIRVTTSSGNSGTALNAIVEEFSTGENYFIVIGDDESGTEDYINSAISAVAAIDI